MREQSSAPASSSELVKLGAVLWSQQTDWPQFLGAARRADGLGFDSIWTWDHMNPIVGSSQGPAFEGWLSLTAFAQATEHAKLGLMVSANTFRQPTLLAKMVTTLDHISGGRAILGIGAGRVEDEHRSFGFEFGSSPGERLRWLGEALPIIRGMLHGEEPTAPDGRYRVVAARNVPTPIQPTLPILVAGMGEKVTLRLVARYADMCNFTGGVETIRRLEPILRAHCDAVGRDHREIGRTVCPPVVVIRDSSAEAWRAYDSILFGNGGGKPGPLSEPKTRFTTPAAQPVGTPEDVAEMLSEYVSLGYRHLVIGFPAPFDEETMVRLIAEVRPRIQGG